MREQEQSKYNSSQGQDRKTTADSQLPADGSGATGLNTGERDTTGLETTDTQSSSLDATNNLGNNSMRRGTGDHRPFRDPDLSTEQVQSAEEEGVRRGPNSETGHQTGADDNTDSGGARSAIDRQLNSAEMDRQTGSVATNSTIGLPGGDDESSSSGDLYGGATDDVVFLDERDRDDDAETHENEGGGATGMYGGGGGAEADTEGLGGDVPFGRRAEPVLDNNPDMDGSGTAAESRA